MFPTLFLNSYVYLVNHINFLNTQKLLKTKIRFNKKIFLLLKSLNTIGCVSKFNLVKSQKAKSIRLKYIYISVPIYKTTPFFKSIRLISTSSKKHYVSLSAIQLLLNTLKSSIIILSTSYGIITHKEAIAKKTGGLLLCIIH